MRLSKGSVSLKEAYGQAMAVTAPLGSVVSTSTAAILYAGYSVVFTTLLALLGSALWIFTLTRYTSKLASAGGYYTYGYSAWRSKKISFFEALIEALAYTFLNAVNAITVYLIISITLGIFGVSLTPLEEGAIIFLAILYPTVISFTHIKFVLGKVVSISATAEALLLIAMFAFSLTKGFHFNYMTPGNVPVHDLATAFVLSMVSISGAGAATYLGEEAKHPTKTITLGMWLSLLIGGTAMFLGTYALVALWNGSLSSLSCSPQPLIYEMYSFGLLPLLIALIMSINSLFASNIGTTLGAARIIFNLSREKSAPSAFSKVNSSKEPVIATIFIGSVTGIVTALSVVFLGINIAFADISAISGILWLSGRIIDGFGVPILYYRIGQLGIFSAVLPLMATGLNVWGVSESISVPDMASIVILTSIVAVLLGWYLIKGRKGNPGSLVVDDNNQVITIDEYIKKLKEKSITT
ncbi:APC family permease [Acidianus sp. HS-5]|uniref:APC family permease n=1 Tax=Acidianus sp. HS-5 TaxID=2886040 RepID=UPI001F324EDB|nr:APC family permease [Acidianus sp. HS-5]BDC19591.1 amino acid permease [Acidianus sp. HS-5]